MRNMARLVVCALVTSVITACGGASQDQIDYRKGYESGTFGHAMDLAVTTGQDAACQKGFGSRHNSS